MKKVKRSFFAAYGSNTNINLMSIICPEAYCLAWGYIQDYELEFRTRENIKDSKDSIVPIVLWSITEDDEMELDVYADLKIYNKKTLKVIITEVNDIVSPFGVNQYREGIEAFVYVMKDEKVSSEDEGNTELYKTILEGYRQNGMDIEYLTTNCNPSVYENKD